ncbi:MAG TPA: hypothetical protein VKB79_06145 [Bryobacteraceae bacterium]|nr:hypothetical protein [Bryobacteraceae bacterium]
MRQNGQWLTGVALALAWVNAAEAAKFPEIQAETLSGKHVALPDEVNGKPTLFVIGFTHASKDQTSYWAKKIPEGMVNFYSVAVLEDVPRLVRPAVTHSMKSDIPKEKRDRFLVVNSDEKELKEAAGFEAPDDAYLVLIDPSGEVRWRFHGPFSHTKLKEMSAQADVMRQ